MALPLLSLVGHIPVVMADELEKLLAEMTLLCCHPMPRWHLVS